MLSRVPAVARNLTLASFCLAGPVAAMELPLPAPGDDIVGQVQVVKAKYEDTFADLGVANDLGYLEMVVANPGVDPWLPGEGAEVVPVCAAIEEEMSQLEDADRDVFDPVEQQELQRAPAGPKHACNRDQVQDQDEQKRRPL